MNIDPGFNV